MQTHPDKACAPQPPNFSNSGVSSNDQSAESSSIETTAPPDALPARPEGPSYAEKYPPTAPAPSNSILAVIDAAVDREVVNGDGDDIDPGDLGGCAPSMVI